MEVERKQDCLWVIFWSCVIYTWPLILFLSLVFHTSDSFHNKVLKYFIFFCLAILFFHKNWAKGQIEYWNFEFSISKLLLGELNINVACGGLVIKSFDEESTLSIMIIPLRSWNTPIWRAKMCFTECSEENAKDKLNIISKYRWESETWVLLGDRVC